jgi:hypothetical protein
MDITHSTHGINEKMSYKIWSEAPKFIDYLEKCRPDEIILNSVLQKGIAEVMSSF